MILPKHLLLDLEGIIHFEIYELIRESSNTIVDKSSTVTTKINEYIGYRPFLIDLFVWPLESSKSYMAHKRFGYYELYQIEDKVIIPPYINKDIKPWNWDSRYSIPWVGMRIHLPLKLEDTCKSIRINIKDVEPDGFECSQGVYTKDVIIKDNSVWFDLVIPGR